MGSTLVMRLVLERLDANDRALNGRLVCTDACELLRQPRHWTVRLSQPLPPSAGDAAWQPHLQRAFRSLTRFAKAQSLAAAAASGSEVNLELAWGLLRPCRFPEVVMPHRSNRFAMHDTRVVDAGAAAIAGGHVHLVPWLVQNGCPLDPNQLLPAAAEHCGMEDMQQLLQLMGAGQSHRDVEMWRCEMAEAAGRSNIAAIEKLSWLLSPPESAGTEQQQQQRRRRWYRQQGRDLLAKAAEGAAAIGSLPVLQWLLGRGLDVAARQGDEHTGHIVLSAALLHRHLNVADWLLDEVGWYLQQQEQQWVPPWELETLWFDAGKSGSSEPVRWLLARRVPVHQDAMRGAAKAGQLEALQLLHASCGLPLTTTVFWDAAGSGSMPTMQWLLQAGCPMDPEAYYSAAGQGDVAMTLWLAQVAGCPWDEETLPVVIKRWPKGAERTTHLLPTVRVLVEAGCPLGARVEVDGVQRHGSAALDRAVQHGHLPLARYLHEEMGVGFGPGTLAVAAVGGCEAVLEWLVGAGCGPGTGYPYMGALQHGDVATLCCLHRLGVPPGDEGWWRRLNVHQFPLAGVRWMVERGAPWDDEGASSFIAEARRHAHPGAEEALAWLEARMAERPPAVRTAQGQGLH